MKWMMSKRDSRSLARPVAGLLYVFAAFGVLMVLREMPAVRRYFRMIRM